MAEKMQATLYQIRLLENLKSIRHNILAIFYALAIITGILAAFTLTFGMRVLKLLEQIAAK
jgi:hypothetical protein